MKTMINYYYYYSLVASTKFLGSEPALCADLQPTAVQTIRARKKMTAEQFGDGTAVIKQDAYLEPFRGYLQSRMASFKQWLAKLPDLVKFSEAWKNEMGFITVSAASKIDYREWAPNATDAHLIGDFN